MQLTIVENDRAASMRPPDGMASATDRGHRADGALRVRRHVLRACLANHVGAAPESIDIVKDASGKPVVANWPEIGVSVASAGRLIAVAIGRAPLGVDIELPERLPERDAWAPFLSLEEAAALDRLPEIRARALALRLWVRKEAVLKALGTGFLTDSRSFTVFGNGCAAWGGIVRDIAVGDDAACAVAVRGERQPVIHSRRMGLSAFRGGHDVL